MQPKTYPGDVTGELYKGESPDARTVAVAPATRPPLRQNLAGSALAQAAANMVPQTLAELDTFAGFLANSQLVPKLYQGKPGDVFVAVLYGLEIGLKPLQALQGIAVVNGKPSLYGDALLAVVKASPLCEYVDERFDPTTMTATCRCKRVGEPETARQFTEANARKAGLWGKAGPWTQYPERMLQMRARGFALRDTFPDVLQGLWLREEAMDIPTDRSMRGEPETAAWEPAEAVREAPAEVVDTSTGEVLPAGPPAEGARTEHFERLTGLLTADVWTSMERTELMQKLHRLPEAKAAGYLRKVEAELEARQAAKRDAEEPDPSGESVDWDEGAPFEEKTA